MQTVLVWFLLLSTCSSQTGRSILEVLLEPYRTVRSLLIDLASISKQQNRSNLRKEKYQKRVLDSVPFPCVLRESRSGTRPESVHKLKPGDIDVIGAMGDSLTAGIGITAINLFELQIEERGKSFSIGGEGTWREFTTLPNILKVFNPNLIGFSLNSSTSLQSGSQLNVAENFAISEDLFYMAEKLIRKIKQDKRIKIDRDWKMITILIGGNDFCGHFCYERNPIDVLSRHRENYIKVLRLLRDNLPRTLVIIVPPPNIRTLVNLKVTNPTCYFTQRLFCPCFFGPHAQLQDKNLLDNVMIQWQKIDLEIATLSEFDRDDFSVVTQPFSVNFTFPNLGNNVVDESYLSADCFHFSQKMHALSARGLWNNLLQPVGKKSFDGGKLGTQITCPSEDGPFIFTRRNS